MLEEGLARPLTLVSAPAGSGKSVLLGEWMARGASPGPVASLALGRESDDRRAFWTQAMTAVARAVPPLAGLAVPPRGPVDGFLAPLLGALDELDEPLVLVLDDLQALRSPEVAADLEWLVDSAPPGIRLVLSTRSDPALRLERLRLDGMVELRAADLAFTLAEALELLAALELPDADVELLWRRCEGWVGGLRLAELSLARAKDPHAFVTGFAGDDHAVSDYLMSEVVSQQPPDVFDFLLRTCVADRVNADLADAITRGGQGHSLLRELEHRDGLATPIDGPGGWYRYHPLLVQVLRGESRRRLRDEQSVLHRRAGRWHAASGEPLEGARHAVEAADWELAAEIIGEHWLVLVTRGSGAALRVLVHRIPAEVVRGDPELALASAGLMIEAGEDEHGYELVGEALDLADRLTGSRARRFAVTATAIELQRARVRGELGEAVGAARVVLEEQWDPELAVEIRAHGLATLGIAEFWAGEPEAAGEHLQQAAGLAMECGNDFTLYLAESYAAAVDVLAGRGNHAWTRARTAIQLAERRGWVGLPHAAVAYGALATVHLWRNERTEASAAADRAGALAGAAEPLLAVALAQLRAWVLAWDGHPVDAMDALGGTQAHGPLPPCLRVSTAITEAELWLRLGEPARARRCLAELESRARASDIRVAQARLELACGDPAAALAELVSFFADQRDAVLPFTHLEALMLNAIASSAIHDDDGAQRSLERALDVVEPRGCPGIVLAYGPPVRPLLRRLLARGTAHRALADDLLAALDEASASAERAPAPLLDPLSERELAVLRFLPTMMSNAEIASEMYVSVNTVKTHLKHVYRKLDVADRRACVKRGRELGLLSPGLGGR